MAGATVAAIEIQGVPGEKFSHDGGDAGFAALEKDVDVIVHKDPGVDRAFPLQNGLAESFEEPGFVFVVSEDVRLVDPPDHDVMQGAGDVQSCLAGHGRILTKTVLIVKLKALYEPTSPRCLCLTVPFKWVTL